MDLNALDLNALPSATDLAALEAAAADVFGVTAMSVAALPGTEMGLRAVSSLGLPEPFRHVAPSYRTHADMLPGSTPIAHDELEAEATRGGTIILANPNNPVGRVIPPIRLRAVASALRDRGGWLIADEAFADAVPEASVLPLLSEGDRIIVFRSFGKFFGLAGLRLGFVSAPGEKLAALRHQFGDWPVSTPAIAIGTAAYRDAAWILATRTVLATVARDIDKVLARHGLEASGACPLFRLVETDDVAGIFDRLARAGILTRPFDYAPRWLRLGLPADAAALDRLDQALGRG